MKLSKWSKKIPTLDIWKKKNVRTLDPLHPQVFLIYQTPCFSAEINAIKNNLKFNQKCMCVFKKTKHQMSFFYISTSIPLSFNNNVPEDNIVHRYKGPVVKSRINFILAILYALTIVDTNYSI